MMVSFIQSNYMGFGSGVVVPGTGISLQNRGHGFTTEAGANQVGPRKRPSHTIIPAFAMHGDGTPQMAFGVMGGPMQSQGHLQMALRVLRYGQNPQAAADAPRWRVTGGKGVAVEPSFDAAVVEQLRARGHEVSVEAGHGVFAFGGAQLVLRDGEHLHRGLRSAQGRVRGGVLRPLSATPKGGRRPSVRGGPCLPSLAWGAPVLAALSQSCVFCV
jgi:gamma-glutamyltranspeptidase/glutathione hydrolase